MDEIKLAVPSVRPEPKQVGGWLNSWQVGQVLRAVVAGKGPSGDLTLRIGSQTVLAPANLDLSKGTILQVQITATQPQLSFKIISSGATGQIASSSPTLVQPQQPLNHLQQQVQLLLTQQGSLSGLLSQLATLVKTDGVMAASPQIANQIQALVKQLINKGELGDPARLKAAVLNSGLLMESKMVQHLPPQLMAERLKGDFKASLLGLLASLDDSEIEAVEGALAGRSKSLPTALRVGQLALPDRQPLVDIDSLLIENLSSALKTQVESALARVTLNQTNVLVDMEQGSQRWAFEIPLLAGEEVQTVSLLISREESRTGNNEREENRWCAEFALDVDALGYMKVSIYVQGEYISASIAAQRPETVTLMEQSLSELRSRLADSGMVVEALVSREDSVQAEATAQSSFKVEV